MRRTHSTIYFTAALILAHSPAPAQTPAKPTSDPILSPAAAYRQAWLPVDLTHRAIQNWSDTEMASLSTAIKLAVPACAARPPADFSGEPLIDLAQLCGLAQNWPAVQQAATRYIEQPTAPKPRLNEAFAAKIDAELHLHDEAAATKDALQMLATLPYDNFTANASNECINYMELLHTPEALSIAAAREPRILTLLGTPAPIPTPTDLYFQALTLAKLQQLQRQPEAATKTVLDLKASLAANTSSDDRIAIQSMQQQFDLLGKPFPPIAPIASLNRPATIPDIPAHRVITALLLFPDWSATGIRLAQQMPETVVTVDHHEAYIEALLVNTLPAQTPPKSLPAGTFNPAYATTYLSQTQTITVPPTTLDTFHATEVPLLILVDSSGIVRLIEPVDDTAMKPGNNVDAAIALIGRQFPNPPTEPTVPATQKTAAP